MNDLGHFAGIDKWAITYRHRHHCSQRDHENPPNYSLTMLAILSLPWFPHNLIAIDVVDAFRPVEQKVQWQPVACISNNNFIFNKAKNSMLPCQAGINDGGGGELLLADKPDCELLLADKPDCIICVKGRSYQFLVSSVT
jgi:hypothetical protein